MIILGNVTGRGEPKEVNMSTNQCTLCGKTIGIRSFRKGYICRECLTYIRETDTDFLSLRDTGEGTPQYAETYPAFASSALRDTGEETSRGTLSAF